MGFNASALSANTIKTFVDRLNKRNKEKTSWPPKRSTVQEDIAKVLGYDTWHALNKALDTPKSEIPTSHSTSKNSFVSTGKWNIPSAYDDNVSFMWSSVEWNKHCLVFGNDETRCDFFTKFAQANPTRPMLVIQGSLALPMDSWNGVAAKQIWDLGALMIGSLDFTTVSAREIIDVFKIWNTTSPHIHSEEVLSMVCGALIQLRDAGKLALDVSTIIDHMEYDALFSLSQRADLAEDNARQLSTYLQQFNENSPHFNKISFPRHKSIVSHWNTIQQIMVCFGNPQNTNHHVLISNTVEYHSKDVQTQIEAYLDWWVSGHAEGLIVVDGLHSNSDLYEFLLRRLAVYKRDGVGVVFGCANPGDFPNPQMYEQIQGRMNRTFTLPKI